MIKLQRIILNTLPARFLISRSKKITMPGFQKLAFYDVVIFFIKQVEKLGLSDRAASISFQFMLAIPPATIFLCTLIPYLPGTKHITSELFMLTNDIFLDKSVNRLVKEFLHDFLNTQRGGLLSIGFLLVVFYSSNAMMGIMRTFNRSLIYTTRRSGIESRWMAIKLTSLLIVLVLATVVLLVTQGALFRMIMDWTGIQDESVRWLIKLLRWVVIISLIYFMIAFVYKYAPAVHKRWKLSSPGTVLATSLIILTTVAFSYWVNTFGSYNKVYGSIGTVLIIMLLIYINSLLLLIGFELNVSINSLKMMAEEKAIAKVQAATT